MYVCSPTYLTKVSQSFREKEAAKAARLSQASEGYGDEEGAVGAFGDDGVDAGYGVEEYGGDTDVGVDNADGGVGVEGDAEEGFDGGVPGEDGDDNADEDGGGGGSLVRCVCVCVFGRRWFVMK